MKFCWVFLFPFFSQAEAPRDCSLNAIKDVCAKHGKIQVGTVNPWLEESRIAEAVNDDFQALETGQGSLVSESDLLSLGNNDFEKMQVEFQDLGLKAQAELIDSLSQGTPLFKLAVSSPNTMMFVGHVVDNEADNNGGYLPTTVTLPWPPNSSSQKTQQVTLEDFKKEFWNKLSDREKKQYRHHSQRLVDSNRKLAEASGYGYLAPAKEEPRLTPEKIKASEINRQKDIFHQRTKRLMELAKKYLIEEIRQRTPDKDKVEILVKKVETVRFKEINASFAECAVDKKNAAYSPLNHEISLCPDYSRSSDLSLIRVISHELGHSIDPCGCTGTHLEFTKSFEEMNDIFEEAGLDSEPDLLLIIMGATNENDRSLSGVNHFLTDDVIDLFEKKGAVKVTQKGIKGAYPFASTYQCLGNRHGFTTAASLQGSLVERRKERRISQGGTIPPVYSNPDYKECMASYAGQSEMGEAMADVFAAKVVGRYALDHGMHDLKDLFDAGSTSLAQICEGGENLSHSHPYARERYEKILIAEPLVQKAFNCKPSPHSDCMNRFGHLPHQVNVGKSSLPRKNSGESVK